FLERRVAVIPVRLVEIDEVGLQAPQRILDALDDVLAREPGVVRPGAHRSHHLGGDDDRAAVAVSPPPLSWVLLRLSCPTPRAPGLYLEYTAVVSMKMPPASS